MPHVRLQRCASADSVWVLVRPKSSESKPSDTHRASACGIAAPGCALNGETGCYLFVAHGQFAGRFAELTRRPKLETILRCHAADLSWIFLYGRKGTTDVQAICLLYARDTRRACRGRGAGSRGSGEGLHADHAGHPVRQCLAREPAPQSVGHLPAN